MKPTSEYLLFFVLLQIAFSFKTCLSGKAGLGSFPVVISRDFRSGYYSIKTHSTSRINKVRSLKVYDDFECALHCSQAGDQCESINYEVNEDSKLHLCEIILAEKYSEAMPQGDRLTYEHISLEAPIHRTCADVYKDNGLATAVYKINPLSTPSTSLYVYCDMHTSQGGWTVIQRRLDGSVDFYRDWAEYKRGFGDKLGEYWLGLDNIHRMTSHEDYTLRIDMEDFRGNTSYAEYKAFNVADESHNYRLTIGEYAGNAGDSLSYHNETSFSTKDRDNDEKSGIGPSNNCACAFKGAWWYKECHHSNPNGQYFNAPGDVPKQGQGIMWQAWTGSSESLKRIEMKIRPNNYKT